MIDRKLSKTQVSLADVYIYDIASASWTAQRTTDEAGGSDTVLESNPQSVIGIPGQRDHMCTLTGVAADESSYNLYVFGGKNESYAMGDVCVLSMPR